MYKVEVTPVVGLPLFTGWSHVATTPSRLGQFVIALAVHGEHAGNVGRDLIQYIEETPVESALGTSDLIGVLQQKAEETGTKLTLSCGLFTPTTQILGAVNGSVFLKREQRMGTLLSAGKETKIVEGKRQVGDVVVLATAQAQPFLPEVELKFKAGYDVDSVIASIIPGLHTADNSSLSSLAFVFGGRQLEVPQVQEAPEVEITFESASAAMEEPAQDQQHDTPVLEIPPALALRGAGKHRESAASQVVPALQKAGASGAQFVQSLHLGEKAKGGWRGLLTAIRTMAATAKRVVATSIEAMRRIRSGEVYVQQRSPRQLLRIVIPVGLIIVVFGGLLSWWLITTRSQVKAAQAVVGPREEQLIVARQQLNENPLQARDTTRTVIAELEQLEKEFSNRRSGQKLIQKKLGEARQFYDDISGMEAVQELEIFYDVRLADSQFLATAVDANLSQVVFLDADKKKAVVLSIDTKQARTISLDQLGTIKNLSVNDEAVAFLANGVFRAPLTDDGQVSRIIEEGDSNRSATLIETFASYVYVLNPEKRNIYRYTQQEDTFSEPIGWVSGAVKFDFSTVVSWAIDGQVWVGTTEGAIHLLASGQEQTFEVKGLTTPFEHSLILFTTDTLENLYVLEANNQRVVVLKKDGTFVKEVSSPSLASATDLFINQDGTKAYAVSGSIVYALNL